MKKPIALMSAAAVMAALGLAAADSSAEPITNPPSPGETTAGSAASLMTVAHMQSERGTSQGIRDRKDESMPMMDRQAEQSGPQAPERERERMERMQAHMEDMQKHMTKMHEGMMDVMQTGMMDQHGEFSRPGDAGWRRHMEDMQDHMAEMHERMMKIMQESMMDEHMVPGKPGPAGGQRQVGPAHGRGHME